MYVFCIAERFLFFLDSVVKCCSCACALDLKLDSSLDFYDVSLFVFFSWQRKSKKVHVIVIFYLYLLSVTDIEDEHPSHKEIRDIFFPVAQADITDCSTYAVVCRLKSSPPYTITSTGGLFIHPDYPGVTVTIPKNAVAPKSPFTLELKVGVIIKVHFLLYKDKC